MEQSVFVAVLQLYLRYFTFIHIVEVCEFNMLCATYFTVLFSEDMMALKNDRNFRSNIQSIGILSTMSGIRSQWVVLTSPSTIL